MNYKLDEYQEFSRYSRNEEAFFSDDWVNHFPKANKTTLSQLAEQEKNNLPIKSNQHPLSHKLSVPQKFKLKFTRVVKGSVVASLVALFDRFA